MEKLGSILMGCLAGGRNDDFWVLNIRTSRAQALDIFVPFASLLPSVGRCSDFLIFGGSLILPLRS